MTMELEIIRDINRCKELWLQFSPMQTLFDTWEYRFVFWRIYQYEPYFMHVKSSDKTKTGLLPLWLNPQDNRYYWFGDVGDGFHWQEDNEFWVYDKEVLEMLLEAAPSPLILECMKANMCKWLDVIPLQNANPKNLLSLKGINSVDEYIARLSLNTRKNLKRKRNKIIRSNPEILNGNDMANFDFMIEINLKKFTDSPFQDRRLVEAFRLLLTETALPFTVQLTSLYLSGELAASEQIFIYNKIYYPLIFSADTDRFSGVGYFLNLINIQTAIDEEMEYIDFAEGHSEYYKSKLYPEAQQFFYEK